MPEDYGIDQEEIGKLKQELARAKERELIGAGIGHDQSNLNMLGIGNICLVLNYTEGLPDEVRSQLTKALKSLQLNAASGHPWPPVRASLRSQ